MNNILKNLDHPVAVSIVIYKNLVESSDEGLIAQHMDLSNEKNVFDFEINIFYECHEKAKDLTEVVLESCQFLCDSYVNQQRKDSKVFDLEMQHIHDFLQYCIGDEMWQRIEVSCRDSKEFDSRVRSLNNVIHIFNCCIDKLIEIVRKDFNDLPSFPSEFLTKLPPIEPRIPNGFEYFPNNWKSAESQKSLIALLTDLKMKKNIEDEFGDLDDFKQKMKEFLNDNISSKHDHILNAVAERVVNGFYRLQLQSNDFSNEFISQSFHKLRWLEIFGVIVIGKFNEIQHKYKNLPTFVVYEKSELRKYSVPWWYKINFENHENGPQKKRAKIIPFDADEFKLVMKKGQESTKKIDTIINKSKENFSALKIDSNSFDEYLYNCEERLKIMRESLDSLILNEKS